MTEPPIRCVPVVGEPRAIFDVGWLPIESAPGDGTPVLLAVKVASEREPIVGEAYWHDSGPASYQAWWWANTGPGDYAASPVAGEVLNWMPLPAPPQD